jgi:hypothetical protein
LKQRSRQQPLADGTSAALDVTGLAKTHFIQVIGLDFVEFLNDRWMVNRKTAKFGQGFGCLILLSEQDSPM